MLNGYIWRTMAFDPIPLPSEVRGESIGPRIMVREYPTTSAADRLVGKFEIENEPCAYRPDLGPCWTWVASKSTHPSPYATIWDDGGHLYAHRVSYEKHKGPIPDEHHLDHLCRNTLCINPLHLEAVTSGVNVLRGVGWCAARKVATHCIHGHEFSDENTSVNVLGHRSCNQCTKERSANRVYSPEQREKHRRRESRRYYEVIRPTLGIDDNAPLKKDDPNYANNWKKEWYQRNRESVKARVNARRLANKDAINARVRELRAQAKQTAVQ